jgi:hypothetical protein
MAFNVRIVTNSRLLSSRLWPSAAEFYPNLAKNLVNRANFHLRFSVKCSFPFIRLTTIKIAQWPKKQILYTEFYLNRTKMYIIGQIFNVALKKNVAFAATILTKLTNTTLHYAKILYTEF